MLKTFTHNAVTELRFYPTFLGRPLYKVSAYYFDGTLFDTGTPRSSKALAEWAKGQQIDQVLLTHHHEDHVGGVDVLDGPIYAPAGSISKIARPKRIPLYRRWVWGQPRPGYAQPLPTPLTTANYTLYPIPTPGQAHPHIAFLVPELGLLFSGDVFIAEQAKFLRLQDDLPAWINSLKHLQEFDFHTLFCCHAGKVTDAKGAIERKLAYWAQIQDQAQTLAKKGYSHKAIRAQLLGKENRLTYISSGQFSKQNLITALLAM